MHKGHELAMALRKAYLTFHRRVNTVTLSQGVTADQFVVLNVVAQEPGMKQVTIVERTASDENTVAAILKLLEKQQLIRRVVHARDGRARCVFLTAKGRRLQKRTARTLEPLRASLLSCMTNQRANRHFLKTIHEFFSDSTASVNGKPNDNHRKQRDALTID